MPLALVVIKTLNYQWEEFRIFLLHVKLWFDKATMLMRIAQGWLLSNVHWQNVQDLDSGVNNMALTSNRHRRVPKLTSIWYVMKMWQLPQLEHIEGKFYFL